MGKYRTVRIGRYGCGLTMFLFIASAFGCEFPLEWNVGYRTDVPYEIELSPKKLEKLAHIDPKGAVRIFADGGEIGVTRLEGRTAETVALRFRVPVGTRKLTAKAGDGTWAHGMRDSAEVDNLLAGATADFTGKPGWIRYEAAVPAEAKGAPVKFELDLVNRSGEKGGRSAWRWDQVFDDKSYYCHLLAGGFGLGGADRAEYELTMDVPAGVEIAALMLIPYPDFEFAATLKKLLGGFNYAPWIIEEAEKASAGTVIGEMK